MDGQQAAPGLMAGGFALPGAPVAGYQPMESIRTYKAAIYLCKSCGQPCHEDGDVGLAHFSEQWDGIYCPMFPLAEGRIEVKWFGMSLETLKEQYPDSYPHRAPSHPR